MTFFKFTEHYPAGGGLMTLPLNFGLMPGLEWAKAWPLILVLFGIVFIVKNVIAEDL
jgi:hypothetical protein